MTDREARELLGLPKTGALDKATVEAAFTRVFREHQTRLNAALCSDERDRESKVLILLAEARKICLGISTPNTHTTPQNAGQGAGTSWRVAPQQNVRPRRQQTSSSGGVQNAAKRIVDVFVHLWLALKNLFEFLRAIPSAFAEVKEFVCDMLDHLHDAGIPKIAMVLVLLLVFLSLINCCTEVINKIVGWFK